MTRTCILHIGLPKTGSSSIQRTLLGFSNDTVSYAKMRTANHSIPLLILYSDDLTRHNGLFPVMRFNNRPGPIQQFHHFALKRKFQNSLKTSGDVIFSGESLCERLSVAELKNLRTDILASFDRIRVIAYVRPFIPLAASSWQQRIKSGASTLFVPPSAYKKRLESFIKAFGRENVELLPFRRDALHEGDVVKDFALRVGIDPSVLNIQTSNESHSLEAISVIMAHNRFSLASKTEMESGKVRQKIVKALLPFGSTKIGFSREFMAPAIDEGAEDLAWIGEMMQMDMVGEAPEVPTPIESELQLLEMSAKSVQAAREMLGAADLKVARARTGGGSVSGQNEDAARNKPKRQRGNKAGKRQRNGRGGLLARIKRRLHFGQ
jgi:hypothetical protein